MLISTFVPHTLKCLGLSEAFGCSEKAVLIKKDILRLVQGVKIRTGELKEGFFLSHSAADPTGDDLL